MNASEFVQYMSEAGLLNNPEITANTNWVDEIFTSAPLTKHHIAITGGNSRMTFMLSLSNLKHDGIVTGSQDRFNRQTLSFNADYAIKDWLKVGQALSYAHTEHSAVTESSEYGSVITNAVLFDPLTPVSYTGQIPAHVQELIDNDKVLLKDGNGNYYGISKVMVGEIINPFVSRDAIQGKTKVDNLFGNIYADIKPFKGFTFTSRLGLDVSALSYHSYNPEYYYNIMAFRDLAMVSDAMSVIRYWQWENFGTFSRTIEDHALDFLIGMSASENKGRVLSGSAGPLVKDTWSFAELQFVTSPSATDIISGGQIESRKLSYFTRFYYSYKGKYLVQGSIRRDAAGEETLPRENHWGIFPSFSAGWVISKEKFFPRFFVDFVKLRASWGLNGSLGSLGTNYSYDNSLVSTMVYPINDKLFVTGTKPARLYNPDLKWETSEQFDFAVDLRGFQDRLTLTIDYYIKKTRDLLTSYTPPIETGNDPSMINAGDVLNRGLEVEIGYRRTIGKLSYALNANMSTLHNEVTYLNPTISRISGSQINLWQATAFEIGQPVWYFRGYKTNGIDPSTGNPVFMDTDGKEGISSDDQTYIGNPIPQITYGGNFRLAYGNIDLNLLIQGQKGNDIIMGMIRTDRPILNKFSYFYTNRWTSQNTSADMPKAGADSRSWNSDLLVFDGSYLRIKQIQIGYNVPGEWIRKISGSAFRVYVSLDDYFTFTDYPGFDPEAGSSNESSLGIDRGQFPTAKKLMLGASVTF
jgi:TonB-linked SusC/RagA family outer membrane protein